MGKSYAYYLIQASQTQQILSTKVEKNGNGHKIQELREGQIRPLTALPEKLQIKAYEKAIGIAEKCNDVVKAGRPVCLVIEGVAEWRPELEAFYESEMIFISYNSEGTPLKAYQKEGKPCSAPAML